MTPTTQYLDSLKSNSRVAQKQSLSRAVRILRVPVDPEQFPWHEMTQDQVRALHEGLKFYAPSTARCTISAIVGCLRFARQAGLISQTEHVSLRAAMRSTSIYTESNRDRSQT